MGRGEHDLRRPDEALELRNAGRAGDRRGHPLTADEPGERDLGWLRAMLGGYGVERLQNAQALELQFVGSPHRTYGLEVSTNLFDWLPLGAVTMDITGSLLFIDGVDTLVPVRFYRLRLP